MSIVSVIAASDYTVRDHSFSLADLLFAVFALSLAVKIKEDAKRPAVSAVYEETAE